MNELNAMISVFAESMQMDLKSLVELNFDLSSANGYDSIDKTLEQYGLTRERIPFSDKKFRLSKGVSFLDKLYLKVNKDMRAEVIFGEPKGPKRKIPADAYSSPGAIWDKIEEENER